MKIFTKIYIIFMSLVIINCASYTQKYIGKGVNNKDIYADIKIKESYGNLRISGWVYNKGIYPIRFN